MLFRFSLLFSPPHSHRAAVATELFFLSLLLLKSKKLTTELQAAKIDMGMFVEGGRNEAFV
jgi:hypothetical protein